MKKIIYSLVIMIAASSLFTSCIEPVEQPGIYDLREAKAEYLKALGNLRAADAELQKAKAAYELACAAVKEAEARKVDAETEGIKLDNELKAIENAIREAEGEFEIDSLELVMEQMIANQEARMLEAETAAVKARENLAKAEEALRVTLADIAVAGEQLTAKEAAALNDYVTAYKDVIAKEAAVRGAEAALWEAMYSLNDYIDWAAKYQDDMDEAEADMEFWAEVYANAEKIVANSDSFEHYKAWKEELDNLKDSIDRYDFLRHDLTQDSAYYMANVFCQNDTAYKEAWEEWCEENNYSETYKYLAADGKTKKTGNINTKPVAPKQSSYKPDYSANIKFPQLSVKADDAALAVYWRFADLVGEFDNFNAPNAKTGNKKVGEIELKDGVYYDTLRANYAMKAWVLGNETGTPTTMKWKDAEDNEVNATSQYGLRGAVSVLRRYLVLIDQATDMEALQKAYDDAKKAYDEDRAILENGIKDAEDQAAADKKAFITSLEELCEAVKDYYANGALSEETSKADSTSLFNAIVNFAEAKFNYMGESEYEGLDTLKYWGNLSEDIVALKDIEYAGLYQKAVTGGMRSIYGSKDGNGYETGKGSVAASTWVPAASDTEKIKQHANLIIDDAFARLLAVVIEKFDTMSTTDEWLTWCNAISALDESGLHAFMDAKWRFHKDYKYDYTNKKLVSVIDGSDFVPKAINDFKEVYNRFWQADYDTDKAGNALKNVKCFEEKTFTEPYNTVFFNNANQIIYADNIGAILAWIDPLTTPATTQADWNNSGILTTTGIFGTNTGVIADQTEFTQMLYAKAQLEAAQNITLYSEALDKIEAWVDSVEKAFDDAKTAADEKATKDYDNAKKEYDNNKAAYDAAFEIAAKLRGVDEDGDLYPEIPVFFAPKDYLTLYVDERDGEWSEEVAGVQLELANKFLADYPEKVSEWYWNNYNVNHVINTHLNPLKTALDAAYTAAYNVYASQDKANFEAVVEAYKAAVKNLKNVAANAYDTANDDYEDAKKNLARFEAGYDGKQLAVETAQDNLDKAEADLEKAYEVLAYAEAAYLQVLANHSQN